MTPSRLRKALALHMLLGLTQSAIAAGGTLADPTRPPNAVLSPDASGGAAVSAQLQSVLIAPGRTLAVINGETVRLGGRYGEATVVKITEAAVILRHPDREEKLELLPGLEKQVRGKRAAARNVPGNR